MAVSDQAAEPIVGFPPPGGWPFPIPNTGPGGGLPHENYGPQLNFTIWLLTILASGFLGLRVYCKFLRHRGLWWDDHVLIAAWAAVVTTSSLMSVLVSMGYGKHIWDFPVSSLMTFPLIANVMGSISTFAAVWSKTGFAITLLRISEGWVKKLIWVIIISMNVFMTVSALLVWIQCTPIEKSWKPFLPGYCWPGYIIVKYDTFAAAYSGAMDITLALLPWKIILSMTMNRREKIGVLIAMSMGVFAGITSFIKVTKIYLLGSPDIIDGVELVVWGTAESCVTIMAASIPILRALVRDVRLRPPPFQSVDRFDGRGDRRDTLGSDAGHWATTLEAGKAVDDDDDDDDLMFGASGRHLNPLPDALIHATSGWRGGAVVGHRGGVVGAGSRDVVTAAADLQDVPEKPGRARARLSEKVLQV